MNKQSAGEVHPAFVHVIQQLTPDEALVLQKISGEGGRFGLHEVVNRNWYLSKDTVSISTQFRTFCESAGVAVPSMSETYLDNLLRLKVLAEEQWSEGKFRPAGYTDHGEYGASVENTNGRLIALSAFGERFLRICIDCRPMSDGGGV
jgi:hypothetical protein